jgi:glycosyltransferase involved in cell wall biosynthesis
MNKQNKLALAMIVKATDDEAEHLSKCLQSIKGHVDGIFIYVNHKAGQTPSQKVLDVVESHTNNYTVAEWTNFGDARNKSFAMVPEDYTFILWLDSDDTVASPDKLKQVVLATPQSVDGIYLAYEYQHDKFGNVTVEHWVARIVRNNGSFAWSQKILHESLEPVRRAGKAMNNEVKIIHHADESRRDASLYRNIQLLEEELQGEGRTPDPRTLFYLGSAYVDAGRFDEAKELLGTYLKLSGWAEERSQAWVHLGNLYQYEEDQPNQRKCYMQALNENPKSREPYIELARLEMENQLWQKAIIWLELALTHKLDPMTTVNYSEETTYRIYMYLADCYFNMGGQQLEKAYDNAKKALEMRPDDTTREYFETIEKVIKHRDMTQGVLYAIKELEDKHANKIPKLINNLPDSLQDNPAILRFRKKHSPSAEWPDNSIVIFTGNSVLGEWGPWSLEEGTGGSEEAVIRLSKQLKDQGWDVWVYGTPGVRVGEYDGVHWRNYWELNLKDKFNVFVAWRSPWFFDVEIDARKKYLWLHDVMPVEEFTKERLANLDKVIVLSEYHRSLFPNIPDDKIFLSANGIDPDDFKQEDNKHERDPHRIIYMSSHVRGLQLLYEIWPEVKKAVPQATLDVYYGWGSYDAVNRDNPERMNWKQDMIDWANKLDGVTDHGKIGQDKIVQEIQKSGIWAYPCPFPEISCITAMKAQSGGAVPVSSTFAALNETVQHGIKLDMKAQDERTQIGDWDEADLNNFKQALLDMLTNHDKQQAIRQDMMKWSRKNQSWKAVAKQWIKEFNNKG